METVFVIERAIDCVLAITGFLLDKQRRLALRFVFTKHGNSTVRNRILIIQRHYTVSWRIVSPHTTLEMLSFISAILSVDEKCEGCIVEAGSYKGSSAAKFSLAARIAGRKLIICDSFEGLPVSAEEHGMSIEGRPVFFHEGEFAGSLEEVKRNIARYGAPEVCEYLVGWYEESLVNWSDPIAAIYMDVDLAASTKSVLRYLYPFLSYGGVVYSQDGHLPLVLNVFEEQAFWLEIAGAPPPEVDGAWQSKLIKLRKTTLETA